ncbi:SCO family protein [Maribacter sp. 4G9]|uniref:SCO family protein n=1 Tax=Maribacter sp. 4G9 TaxID=1889777 RepID=UPI000C160BD0|nr:SCO family protein [Maribacter sp. 4G9]PIB25301.1 photosynthetic protein synthase II [Maribacter sp. 4G9]
MTSPNNRNLKFGVFTVLVVIILSVAYYNFIYSKEIPIYNPADLNPELVDLRLRGVTENHKVSDFHLINQNGKTISQNDYKDKIYVTDFFFTRCPSICPVMANNMEKLQERFMDTEEVMLLSLSVTPEMDSVPLLLSYSQKYNAKDSKWNITTGDKEHIYELARKSYFAVNDFSDGLLQDFIHTPNFILVDTKKQIRGIYDGTKDLEMERLVKDIETLLSDTNQM